MKLKGYDAEKRIFLDEERTYEENASASSGSDYPLSLRLALYAMLQEKGYQIRYVLYKGEEITARAEKDGHVLFFYILTDSEAERIVWRLSELSDQGRCIVLRQRMTTEPRGVESASFAEMKEIKGL